MKHSYNMIHTTFGHSIPSSQIIHILVLMLLDVERSQNVEIWINWILCINWIAQVPHEPRSSAMPNWTWSSPSLLLPGGSTESARFLCDRTHVIILQKKKLRKLWKFTKTVAKSQQTGRFGTPFICWNTRFLIHVLCVQSIHLPKGWETATCRHRSVETAEGAAMVAFGRARLWRGWLSQLRKRHVPSGEARYSRPVEVDASLGCPGWGTRLIYLSTLKCRLIYSS